MKTIINLIFNTFSVELVSSSCGSAAVGWLFFYGTLNNVASITRL
jgi:hypothetical protein